MRKTVQARRQKLRDLGEKDHAARCAHCRKPLLRVRLEMGERFCDRECEDTYDTFRERWAELKAKVSR